MLRSAALVSALLAGCAVGEGLSGGSLTDDATTPPPSTDAGARGDGSSDAPKANDDVGGSGSSGSDGGSAAGSGGSGKGGGSGSDASDGAAHDGVRDSRSDAPGDTAPSDAPVEAGSDASSPDAPIEASDDDAPEDVVYDVALDVVFDAGDGAPVTPPPSTSCVGAAYQNHLYWFCTNNKDWNAAEPLCQAIGGHLTSITSAGEQAFIDANIGGNQWLIGLDKKNASGGSSAGTWEWLDGGDPFGAYQNWDAGDPDSSDCGAMLSTGKWVDWTCGNAENWICEVE